VTLEVGSVPHDCIGICFRVLKQVPVVKSASVHCFCPWVHPVFCYYVIELMLL